MKKGKYNVPHRNIIPQAKMLRVFKAAFYLINTVKTYDQIAECLGISKRTAYRYVDILENLGFNVERNWDGYVFITIDKCPLCGRKHKTEEILSAAEVGL